MSTKAIFMSTGFPVPAQKVASPALIHESAVLEPQDLEVLNMPYFWAALSGTKGTYRRSWSRVGDAAAPRAQHG